MYYSSIIQTLTMITNVTLPRPTEYIAAQHPAHSAAEVGYSTGVDLICKEASEGII